MGSMFHNITCSTEPTSDTRTRRQADEESRTICPLRLPHIRQTPTLALVGVV